MIKGSYRWLFLALIIADLIYSWFQFYHTPLDGDLAAMVMPAPEYRQSMNDPFGISVLLHHDRYPSPNRFFAQWSIYSYFRSMPDLLQVVLNPVSSVYAAAAFAKIAMQLLFLIALVLIALKISGGASKEAVLAALLTVPLFQTAGYNSVMGLVLHSITYSFFYSLPVALLMCYLYLLFQFGEKARSGWFALACHAALLVFAIVLAFNGPLIPGIVLVIAMLYSVHRFVANLKQKEKGSAVMIILKAVRSSLSPVTWHLLFCSVLSAYSIWLGGSNSENDVVNMPLHERYARIPLGLWQMFTNKIGLPLLVFAVLMNVVLVRRYQHVSNGSVIERGSKWLLAFTFIYILLLPLGGYRWYRPDVIRFDTMLPVFAGLILLFTSSACYLLRTLPAASKKFYAAALTLMLAIFTVADGPEWKANACERRALNDLSQANEGEVMVLDDECKVMSWVIIQHEEYSRLNCEMLKIWNIANPNILYRQE